MNLNSADELTDAILDFPTNEYLIEEMISNVKAELLVGIVWDHAHGYVLTIAPGGIHSELFQESISLMVPAKGQEVKQAISELKFAKILTGYRGQSSCDIKLIVDTIVSLQDYVTVNPVAEIEINPLLCGENFAIAGDVLIVKGEFND